METAISYLRKSISIKGMSDEEAISYQQGPIEEYCIKNGINLLKNFSDVGYSGKNINRPDLQGMLEFLKEYEGKIDHLLIYSIDRFGRDLENNVSTMLRILDHVKNVTFIVDNLSSNNEFFKTLFLIKTAAAQEERENLLKRLSDGRKSKVINKGKFNGNYTPLGFIKNNTTSKDSPEYGMLIPAIPENTNDLEAIQGFLALQFIFLAYLFGVSLRKIADCLNSNFPLTRRGKMWSYKSVSYILKNPTYIGVLKGKFDNYENYWVENSKIAKIIDPNIYEFIQYKIFQEKSGRKNKVTQRFPQLMACTNCLVPLIFNDGEWCCSHCNGSISSNKIYHEIKEKLLEISMEEFDKRSFNSLVEEKIQTIKNRMNSIKRKIDVLIVRKSLIQNMFKEDIKMRDRLIDINTKETVFFQEELIKDTNLEKFFRTIDDHALFDETHKKIQSYIMGLPFLIFIDFEIYEIEILFHSKIFNKELSVC